MTSREFWQDKRVFLTGHTGFKGSWMALWLQRLGARVFGYSLAPPTDPSLYVGAKVADGMEASTEADVRDQATLQKALSEADPEIVIHMAAQSLVHEGYRRPLETFATNIMGTANLLEAARHSNARAVVSVTTDKCYQNNEWDWGYRETDRLGGKDPYSGSKACAELVTAAYRASYFGRGAGSAAAAIATARAGNVIGGGDWSADRLIPDLVRGILEDEPVAIRQPDAVRPWQHVLEPVRGYLQLARRLSEDGPEYDTAWNFGPDDRDCRTVRWVADRIVELWGDSARWELDSVVHPPEATFLRLDCSKAGNRLDWRPRLPLDEALRWTVDWYRAHLRGGDLRTVSVDQIAAYEAIASRKVRVRGEGSESPR